MNEHLVSPPNKLRQWEAMEQFFLEASDTEQRAVSIGLAYLWVCHEFIPSQYVTPAQWSATIMARLSREDFSPMEAWRSHACLVQIHMDETLLGRQATYDDIRAAFGHFVAISQIPLSPDQISKKRYLAYWVKHFASIAQRDCRLMQPS